MRFLEDSIDSLKGQSSTTQFELHTMNIQELFKSLYKIPFYQRPYDWEESDILGLMTDIFHESTEFNVKSDSKALKLKFIGTIVLAPQKAPAVKPSQVVYDIVDGQQRITTLQLILCQLHLLLVDCAEELKEIEKNTPTEEYEKSQDAFHWLKQRVKGVRRNVLESLYAESDKSPRSALVNFIPRLIREDKDRWGIELSNTELEFKYKSGPSLFLFNYLNSAKKEISQFSIADSEMEEYGKVSRYIEDSKNDRYRTVEKRSKFIKQTIIELIDTKISEEDQLVKKIKNELGGFLTDIESIEKLSKIYFLVVFSLYLLNKVSSVVVIANNESEAFDIFDSLNTTGEPLNAIQVLNALVVSYEINFKGEGSYETTHSKELMDGISGFINTKDSLEDRSKLIYDILNSYKISQTGTALRGKQLSIQIDAVKVAYGGNEKNEKYKKGVLVGLYNIVKFYEEVWSNNEGSRFRNNLDIQVLYSTKHTVVIPVLNYFYNYNREDFNEAVQVVLAFSVLWRVVNGGTDGIDNEYKRLFAENKGLLCIERTSKEKVSVERLKKELYTTLEVKINRQFAADDYSSLKQKFVKLSAHNNFYKLGRFAKYFLLCALENTKRNDDTQGNLLVYIGDRKSTMSLLKLDYWDRYEIEHIAPQSQSNGWSDDIYENSNVINYIGNTTIIPKNENIELSNNSFKYKMELYELYSIDSQEAFNKKLEQLINDKVLKDKGSVNDTYLKTVSHLTGLKEWNASKIDDLSIELLSLGWNFLGNKLEP